MQHYNEDKIHSTQKNAYNSNFFILFNLLAYTLFEYFEVL